MDASALCRQLRARNGGEVELAESEAVLRMHFLTPFHQQGDLSPKRSDSGAKTNHPETTTLSSGSTKFA